MSNKTVSWNVTSSGIITVFLDGESHQVAPEHKLYGRVKSALLASDWDMLEKLLVSLDDLISDNFMGRAELNAYGEVVYNGEVVHSVVTDRIRELFSLGFPVDPALRFLENLQKNPSPAAVQELYDFLANRHLPLTEDGCFLGYKKLRANMTDVHSGRVRNDVGTVVEMDRATVDPDRRNECSYGLHVGALEYVLGFGGTLDPIVVVKVNPADVIAVPLDYNAQKMRVCKYEVLYLLENKKPLPAPAYGTDGKMMNSVEFVDAVDASPPEMAEWDYSSWSQDALANECVARKIYSSRQKGRDKGRKAMTRALRRWDKKQHATA